MELFIPTFLILSHFISAEFNTVPVFISNYRITGFRGAVGNPQGQSLRISSYFLR